MAKRKLKPMTDAKIKKLREKGGREYDRIASGPDSFTNRWSDPRRALPQPPPAPPYDGKRILKQFAADLEDNVTTYFEAMKSPRRSPSR